MSDSVQHDVSSGGVLFRRESGRVEVVLIQTRVDRWQIPKGAIEEGETREQAARREVREETGIDGDVLEHLETIEYWFTAGTRRQKRHKSVHLFLLSFLTGDTKDHDDESIDAKWFPIEEAAKKLSFANERHALDLARDRIAALGSRT
jgi:8-oxo-dGTP diphosphatase